MEHFENTRKYFLTLSEHNYGVAKASRSSHDAREAKMKAEIYQDFADVLETNIDKSRKALEALRDEKGGEHPDIYMIDGTKKNQIRKLKSDEQDIF